MKYINNIIGKIRAILWIGFFVVILQGEVVINEFFMAPASPTDAIPHWIELYNNSDTGVDLTNWSINIYINANGTNSGFNIPFIENPIAEGFPPLLHLNNTFIQPHGYLLIASYIPFCSSEIGCTFYNNQDADIWAPFIFPGTNYARIERIQNRPLFVSVALMQEMSGNKIVHCEAFASTVESLHRL